MTMTNSNESQKTSYTLEMICQQKTEKLAEIQISKQKMTKTVRHLFKPEESMESAHAIMHNFNSGVAILNGLITGFKIMKRIRDFFRKK